MRSLSLFFISLSLVVITEAYLLSGDYVIDYVNGVDTRTCMNSSAPFTFDSENEGDGQTRTPCKTISYVISHIPIYVNDISIQFTAGTHHFGQYNNNTQPITYFPERNITLFGDDRVPSIITGEDSPYYLSFVRFNYLTIKNLVFQNLKRGVMILNTFDQSTVNIENCVFRNNSFVDKSSDQTTYGGALILGGVNMRASISSTSFHSNSANMGGAITVLNGDNNVVISGCSFINNTAQWGGALYALQITGQIISNEFTDNIAMNFGGAIFIQESVVSPVLLDSNIFTDNCLEGATYKGQTIQVFYSAPDVVESNSVYVGCAGPASNPVPFVVPVLCFLVVLALAAFTKCIWKDGPEEHL